MPRLEGDAQPGRVHRAYMLGPSAPQIHQLEHGKAWKGQGCFVIDQRANLTSGRVEAEVNHLQALRHLVIGKATWDLKQPCEK